MEVLGAASSILSIAVLAKDVTQLAFTFQDSLKEISISRKEHVGLANRIINCMESVVHVPRTSPQESSALIAPNIVTLRNDLQVVLKRCSELRCPKNGIKAWVLREHITRAIDKLKADFEISLQVFSSMSIVRLEHRLSELHGKIDHLMAKLDEKLVKSDSDVEMAEALVRAKSMDKKTMKRSLRRAKKSLACLRSDSLEQRYFKMKIKTVSAALVCTQASSVTPPYVRDTGSEDPFLDALDLLRVLRSPRPDLPLDLIAIRLDSMSIILNDTGDYEAASFVSAESVKLLRSFDLLPSTRPFLATALHNSANHLRYINCREALASSVEAVMLFESLHDEDATRYLPSLVFALNTLANCHERVGNRIKSIDIAMTVVQLQRQRCEEESGRFELDLAMALNNLAAKLRRIDHGEARSLSEEACDLFRRQTPDALRAYHPEYAAALTSYSTCLLIQEEYEAALESTKEALRIRRVLCDDRPSVYTPQLAESLLNLFKIFTLLHRDQDADVALHAAIDIYRDLLHQHPCRHHKRFGLFLHDIVRTLLPLHRTYEALSLLREILPSFAQTAKESQKDMGCYVSVLEDLATCSLRLNMLEDAEMWSQYANTGQQCLKLLDRPAKGLTSSLHCTASPQKRVVND